MTCPDCQASARFVEYRPKLVLSLVDDLSVYDGGGPLNLAVAYDPEANGNIRNDWSSQR